MTKINKTALGVSKVWLVFESIRGEYPVSERGPFLLGFATSKAEAESYCKKMAKKGISSGNRVKKIGTEYQVQRSVGDGDYCVDWTFWYEEAKMLGQDQREHIFAVNC